MNEGEELVTDQENVGEILVMILVAIWIFLMIWFCFVRICRGIYGSDYSGCCNCYGPWIWGIVMGFRSYLSDFITGPWVVCTCQIFTFSLGYYYAKVKYSMNCNEAAGQI